MVPEALAAWNSILLEEHNKIKGHFAIKAIFVYKASLIGVFLLLSRGYD